MIIKKYLLWMEPSKIPVAGMDTDYRFTSNRDEAAYWPTKALAQASCRDFGNSQITICSSTGGTYVCGDFKLEERKPDEFVVSGEAPFVLNQENR